MTRSRRRGTTEDSDLRCLIPASPASRCADSSSPYSLLTRSWWSCPEREGMNPSWKHFINLGWSFKSSRSLGIFTGQLNGRKHESFTAHWTISSEPSGHTSFLLPHSAMLKRYLMAILHFRWRCLKQNWLLPFARLHRSHPLHNKAPSRWIYLRIFKPQQKQQTLQETASASLIAICAWESFWFFGGERGGS